MHKLQQSHFTLLTILGSAILLALFAAAAVQAQSIPPDFNLILSAPGVRLFQKDYPGGNPDFVQVANLSQGASVALLYGAVQDEGFGQGAYGGDDPSFQKQSLDQVWQAFSAQNKAAFCLSNGGFFSTRDDPAKLAFPLKVGGEVISDGYGSDEYPGQQLMLEIWEQRADIVPLSGEALYGSSAPDLIGGLSAGADKEVTKTMGRTFIGLADADGDGSYEIFLVFNSLTSTQPAAADILRSFGAEKVIMLDGGGSAQLICRGKTYVASSREIPQTIAVLSGEAESPTELSPEDILDGLQGGVGKAVQDQVDELQEAAVDKMKDLLRPSAEQMKEQLNDWVSEQIEVQERQLKNKAEAEINRVFNQICGSALLPGVVAIAWWRLRKSHYR